MQEQKPGFSQLNRQGLANFDSQLLKSIRSGKQPLSKDTLSAVLKLFVEMIKAIEDIHKKNQILAFVSPDIFMAKPAVDHNDMTTMQMPKKITISRKEFLDLDRFAYISPEQTGRISRTVDYRSNYYSLGVTMYELITGQNHLRRIVCWS